MDNLEITVNKSVLENLPSFVPDSIFSKLKHHQVEGIKFILSKIDNGCILAHAMGNSKPAFLGVVILSYLEKSNAFRIRQNRSINNMLLCHT